MYLESANTCHGGTQIGRHILILAFSLLVFISKTEAHEGPPFPIIVDREIGPYLVSIWTDPDIGIGTFFVIMEPNPNAANFSKDITSVKVGVAPTSGRLAEKVYSAEPQRTGSSARYLSEVNFDKGEKWRVRVIIKGSGWEGELQSEVEATPPGSIGPIVVLIYALPFIGIGILWIRAIIRRRESVD